MNLNQLIQDGATFFVSHSGGKDSQAMYSLITSLVPSDQIVVVHSDLGEAEWQGVKGHIRDTIEHELHVVSAQYRDGTPKTFLNMVERRFQNRPDAPCWPSTSYRQCTSDLKRDPIEKFVRGYMRSIGSELAVNCMGLRAEESSARAKRDVWSLNKRLSKAGRLVYDWLPIHDWSTEQVFEYITSAGQDPFWAYADGNERLSCVFCIMGCNSDLRHGARIRPELAAKYIELERRTGYSMFPNETLESKLAGIPITVIN